MGWLKKAVKKVKGAAKTYVGGRTKLGRQVFKAADNVAKKGLGAFTAGQVSGADTEKSQAALAVKSAEDQAALDAKTAADAETARVQGIETAKTGAANDLRAKLGLGGIRARPGDTGTGVTKKNVYAPGAKSRYGVRKPGKFSTVTTGQEIVQGGSTADPAVLAAQEEEQKKKAALLAAQKASIPKTSLG